MTYRTSKPATGKTMYVWATVVFYYYYFLSPIFYIFFCLLWFYSNWNTYLRIQRLRQHFSMFQPTYPAVSLVFGFYTNNNRMNRSLFIKLVRALFLHSFEGIGRSLWAVYSQMFLAVTMVTFDFRRTFSAYMALTMTSGTYWRIVWASSPAVIKAPGFSSFTTEVGHCQ